MTWSWGENYYVFVVKIFPTTQVASSLLPSNLIEVVPRITPVSNKHESANCKPSTMRLQINGKLQSLSELP